MLIVSSGQTDVFHNLAVEEWLLDHAPKLPLLFLCVNEPCVVIGKNQNPWRECRLSLMEEEGVPLARRVSGGGAVYHDPGNLNVGVIVPRTEYREDQQYELIFRTLEKFGIKSSRGGRSSLVADGKKFSGQAFCYRKDRVLHHGTLLVNADLDRLGCYLGAELDGIETKAVASVPANVANLSSFAAGITIDALSATLIETFKSMYGGSEGGSVDVPEEELFQRVGKLSSKEWNLCHTPNFTFQGAEVKKGRVINESGAPLFEEWLES